MNETLCYEVLQAVLNCNTAGFVVCAGARNVAFVEAISRDRRLEAYYFPEERSATFFALGRSRLYQRPMAVITTSGSAAAEMLPAAMEAYYSGVPLILISADRPRAFRGSGAPQAAEQVGLFGPYAPFALDISAGEPFSLAAWDQRGPAHLNVCMEEPQSQPPFEGKPLSFATIPDTQPNVSAEYKNGNQMFDRFLQQVEKPLVIVSTLDPRDREAVAQFLLQLNAPALIESISGLREDARLQHLALHCTEQVWQNARVMEYEIDAILRIGGVPTHRIWRDLEYRKEQIKVCALSRLPFSGLSWSRCVVQAPLDQFLAQYKLSKSFASQPAENWLEAERQFRSELEQLFTELPTAEPSLVHALSKLIPPHSHVYLGNSLPIREWDLAATQDQKFFQMRASRGINGIDGQLSTFLGLSTPDRENWALLGDLTALYDMAGYWAYSQLPPLQATVALINNGGGQIFARIFKSKKMLNEHALSFEPLAHMWGFAYQRLAQVPDKFDRQPARLLEIVPDPQATRCFWERFASISRFNEQTPAFSESAN